jgi:hypothetical protein
LFLKKPRNQQVKTLRGKKKKIMMQSSKKNQLERVFLSTEMPFQTAQPLAQPSNGSRFPKVLSLYAPHHFINENGTPVFEWCIICSESELKTTAKMYYSRYNLASK